MQNRYTIWQYSLLGFLLLIGGIYALPNLFGEEPAVQISAGVSSEGLTQAKVDQTLAHLEAQHIPYKHHQRIGEDLIIHFYDAVNQFKAKDVLTQYLGESFTIALSLIPATPQWLSRLGAYPMKLGLDLRGGVHFLLEVDMASVFERRINSLFKQVGQILRQQKIRYQDLRMRPNQQGVSVKFSSLESRDQAYRVLQKHLPDIEMERLKQPSLHIRFHNYAIQSMQHTTIEQTMGTLRNRVNELGISEAVVQQQGSNRIAIDLPGVQDVVRAKEILGGTATLQFRLVDYEHDVAAAVNSKINPPGSTLYWYQERPYLLKNQVILSGDSITSALSAYDVESASPAVKIQLGGGGEAFFNRTTRQNVNRLMAILFVETKTVTSEQTQRKTRKRLERVISVATIRGPLGNSFQITGLNSTTEARDLALLLRAGALPAAVDIVEETTVGPSLGLENIKRGLFSLLAGLLLVIGAMALYYRWFGVFADLALLCNLVFLVACLSLIGATLTLPGIAGIVLTVGMAVDANVLIYERIREELRQNTTPQAAIQTGYDKAFSTIVDANVTTLIVALVLFAVGSGPIQGFAITLIIGLLTSMLTAIWYTRAMVNLAFGSRRVRKLPIGI